jgi:hypothetical protein
MQLWGQEQPDTRQNAAPNNIFKYLMLSTLRCNIQVLLGTWHTWFTFLELTLISFMFVLTFLGHILKEPMPAQTCKCI